jgi:hypothetical protein
MHIAPVAATRFGQQETVEQKRHSTLAPGQLLQHGCGFFAEEHAAQRRHVQLAGLQALGEHAEELPQPVLQERARVFAGFPHVAGVRVQRLAGRKGLAPQRGRGEAEAARRVVGGFHLEQEQQAVDQDQAFVPEIAGKLGTVGKFGETFDIDGMVQHLLRELLDRFTRLLAEVARDPSLLHAGLVQNLLQRGQAQRLRERAQETKCIWDVTAALPLGINMDDDFGGGPGRIADYHANLSAIRQKARALAGSEEHTVGDLHPAETVGGAASCRSVKVFVKTGGPDAQPRAGIVHQKPASIIVTLAGTHLAGVLNPSEAQPLHQGLNDLPPDSCTVASA